MNETPNHGLLASPFRTCQINKLSINLTSFVSNTLKSNIIHFGKKLYINGHLNKMHNVHKETVLS